MPFAGVLAGTPIVPEHIWSTVGDPTKYADTKPVGTGPFTLDKFAPTQYSLKKNPTYWQAAKIAPSEVVFPAKSSNQSTNQLDVSSGKFDWSYNFLPDVKQTYVARDPKHNVYWFPPGGAIGLFLNLTKAPYTNVSFRQGISAALNRTTIANKAVNGYLTQASQSGLILPNLKKWLDPSLPNSGQRHPGPSAAMADFAKAGYTKKGSKLVSASGKQATMTIDDPAELQRLGRGRQGGPDPAVRGRHQGQPRRAAVPAVQPGDPGRDVRRGLRRLRRHRRPLHRLQQRAQQRVRDQGQHPDGQQLRAVQERRRSTGDLAQPG